MGHPSLNSYAYCMFSISNFDYCCTAMQLWVRTLFSLDAFMDTLHPNNTMLMKHITYTLKRKWSYCVMNVMFDHHNFLKQSFLKKKQKKKTKPSFILRYATPGRCLGKCVKTFLAAEVLTQIWKPQINWLSRKNVCHGKKETPLWIYYPKTLLWQGVAKNAKCMRIRLL